ncbi:hypothetical protein E2C01_018840 [Portunus trituberculatus]|uniref:Uncharacterized protein n=1 Tax=Portunus trituberculatus TaxID=210409 RepID=A0A5B7DWC6_PORTR|nr:hypothetical protein [Portunus trituberculatus]
MISIIAGNRSENKFNIVVKDNTPSLKGHKKKKKRPNHQSLRHLWPISSSLLNFLRALTSSPQSHLTDTPPIWSGLSPNLTPSSPTKRNQLTFANGGEFVHLPGLAAGESVADLVEGSVVVW